MVRPLADLPVGHHDVAHVLGVLGAVPLVPRAALLPVEGSTELDPLVHRDPLDALQRILAQILGSLLGLITWLSTACWLALTLSSFILTWALLPSVLLALS